jgi:hypothetical protein
VVLYINIFLKKGGCSMKKQITYFLGMAFILLLSTKALAQTAIDVVCATPCISATEIVNSAVTAAKIQASAVTTAKILDGTVANADISTMAAISPSKISGTAWTATTDGSGSGLDADSLDGMSSSQFLRNDEGGTVAGDLEVAGNFTLSGNITSSGDICIGACE